MSCRIGKDRINKVFLNVFRILEVIAVEEGFGTDVGDVVELRDDTVPVVGTGETVGTEDLSGEVAEDEDGGLVRSVEK